ncbi:MAG: heme-binding protein [SAR116 cluster bacterium]|nr:MAG: heme-binding protein [SAR116 cluster bacterium]
MRQFVVALAMVWCGTSSFANEEAIQTFSVLTPSLAHELVGATVAACEEDGFQVTAAVVDRFGVPQALLRNRFSGPHTPDTAIRKAYTAVSFRTNTLDLVEPTKEGSAQSGARGITNALMLGGGILVEAAGEMLGGLGVSGAPTGEDDQACGLKGIQAISDKLPF